LSEFKLYHRFMLKMLHEIKGDFNEPNRLFRQICCRRSSAKLMEQVIVLASEELNNE